ncbi:hypothetical protein L915_07461 [Phytophthora nicotianae]|uniref:Uncharacterized protein n=1 Tax=Phytophthora nicotianae TaxID=4792 RepID=W2H168_PHYNI|nr:hypothetical protein L915_07461 [Phytophthora nicotianae]
MRDRTVVKQPRKTRRRTSSTDDTVQRTVVEATSGTPTATTKTPVSGAQTERNMVDERTEVARGYER